jgi:YihY family inner membrane protein
MNIIEHSLRKIDAFQQNKNPLSFIVGVIKKYGDDNGGNLVVSLTYSIFLTIFPLLLLLITILRIALVNYPTIRQAVLRSTFSQFPIVGVQISNNIQVLKEGSAFGLIVGILGLTYGSIGLAKTGQYVMEQVWNIEGIQRPNFYKRIYKGLLFLVVLAIGLLVTTALAGFGTFGKQNIWLAIISEGLAILVNIAIYITTFRVLTPRKINIKSLIPGAIFGGITWTILQAFGGFVVSHYLRNDTSTYGTFGTVLGLIAWIYLGTQITVFSAVINTVIKRHLWPRSLVQPPLTKADQISLSLHVIEKRQRPEQEVITNVIGQPITEDVYLATNGYLNKKIIGTSMKTPKE